MRPRGGPVGGDLVGLSGKGVYEVPKVPVLWPWSVSVRHLMKGVEGEGRRRKAKGKGESGCRYGSHNGRNTWGWFPPATPYRYEYCARVSDAWAVGGGLPYGRHGSSVK